MVRSHVRPHMHYAYILQSQKSKRYYIGNTDNLKRRLIEHNEGKTVSTKNKGPWELVHSESFDSKLKATLK